MRTAHLLTVCVSVATISVSFGVVGPQVNKCEQVSSDYYQMPEAWNRFHVSSDHHHQMSVVGGGG